MILVDIVHCLVYAIDSAFKGQIASITGSICNLFACFICYQ